MAQFNICGKKVGETSSVYIIAEACDNHMGNLDTAKKMIDGAKSAGADGIKFQHHIPEEEMLPDIPMSDNFEEPLYEFLKKYALSLDDHIILKSYCEKAGIDYLCTPFSYKAAEELKSIGVDFFKIGSGEMTDLASLEIIAKLGNPMLLSTGMCTLEEIKETYIAMKKWGADFAFLNCVSEYPPRYDEMNLKVINTLQKEFPDIVIGHSDHTPDLYTSFAAVALGAKIIEKHIILDKNTPGPDQSVSIDMKDLSELVSGIRKIESALGDKKIVQERERQIREWAFRSVVSTCQIPKGTIIKRNMLCTKRPGTGIPSKELSQIVGKTTKNSIDENSLLRREDIIW